MAVHATEPSTTPTARFDDLDLDRDEDRAEWQRRLSELATVRLGTARERLERLGIIDTEGNLVSRELPPDMLPDSEATLETGWGVDRPRMIVVAGPPGSGKTSSFPVTDFGLDAFNIDDRCAQLLGSYRAIPREVRRAVAEDCERFVIEHIHAGRAFAVETTLRTTVTINQARQARTRGFATELIFVATASVEENVARVLQRAQGGGHGASERDVRAIYEASISNLIKAISVFERVDLYDSTRRWSAPRLVATVRDRHATHYGTKPEWLQRFLLGDEPWLVTADRWSRSRMVEEFAATAQAASR
jgi:predicted ABC-type ATPase